MKGTEQYFPVVLFIMLYKVVLTLKSVDEILKCDHSSRLDPHLGLELFPLQSRGRDMLNALKLTNMQEITSTLHVI